MDDGTSDDPYIPPPGTRVTGLGLGIDVGGTGVKAALVDLATGELASPRIREKTPQPATPEACAETIASVVSRIAVEVPIPDGTPVGCGVPGVVKYGRVKTAANIDPTWIDTSVDDVVGGRLGRRVLALNDADAAGIAEMAYGAGRERGGTVLLLTLGTGIGSALFIDGRLVPNTELGHLQMKGKDAELRVSGAARERRRIGWKRWASEFEAYLAALERYLWPDLIILGGGVSKDIDRFGRYLHTVAPVVTASFLNVAGIVGAAFAAASAQAAGVAPGADVPTASTSDDGDGRGPGGSLDSRASEGAATAVEVESAAPDR